MKQLAIALLLSFVAAQGHSQGTITIINGTYSLVRTNTAGFGGTIGNTAPTAGGFYYAVFTAPSTVTTIDTSLQQLLTSTWTFTGVYATNSALTTGGRLNGGSGVATTSGWPGGVTNSYLVLGWGSGLGTDWNTVANEMAGATLCNGLWSGPGFTITSGFNDFLGASMIAYGEAGGGPQSLPTLTLFGTSPTGGGVPISHGWDLFAITAGAPCPEPSALALAGLGAVLAMIVRKRR
jgi:hypothetical protein